MKIEILLVDSINEKCTGGTCFEAPNWLSKEISSHCFGIQGIVIIDGSVVKFSFSPTFMDGDIFTSNQEHRLMVKYLIPLWVLEQIRAGKLKMK